MRAEIRNLLTPDVDPDGPVNGGHYVIVNRFDWPTLRNYFDRLVAGIAGADWNEVATQLSRYGHWEFEDYTPAPS